MIETSYTELSIEDKGLVDVAEQALQNAYNPYNSQIKVASAVRTASGDIVSGASYYRFLMAEFGNDSEVVD